MCSRRLEVYIPPGSEENLNNERKTVVLHLRDIN